MMRLLFMSLLLFSMSSHAFNRCERGIPATNNPAYPATKVYKTLICEDRVSNKVLIKELESLLFHQSFKLPIEKEGSTYRLHVGTAGSFSLWRDLINLNLGRAYYEKGELKKALSYWDNILNTSPYYPLATLESNYARFKTRDLKTIKKKLSQLKSYELQGERQEEMLLQKALLELRHDKFLKATEMVKDLTLISVDLKELKERILAESLFGQYLKTHTSLPFKEKIRILKIITNAVETIRPEMRDEKLVYLAAEAYWHTAVALRIEDPVKYQKEWHHQLEIADAWISPLVDKSIQDGKAQLSEEAFFFSIALLWEREFHTKALVRLKKLDSLYPLGVYREDAYQLLGDYYFDEQDFHSAIPFYRKLAQVGSESKAAYGVYKAAWSFYNIKDKWKSLRHFERLFQFYLGKDRTQDDKHELMKESRQDLLLVLSEILSSPRAIEELKTFKITPHETKEMIRDLAKLYQRNGNYKDSTQTWNYLLTHHLNDSEAPQWIMENAQDYYANGKRNEISHQIKKHYASWKTRHFNQTGDEHIAKEWSRIILSLHREAKKSEDPLFWKATDLAYETYEELRPDGQEGEVWYFGAQKFQFQNNFWRSVEWYKRAADVKGYNNADDAALSALGLLNDKSGELSLEENKEPLKSQYAKLADYSRWFFERSSKKLDKQKELAHFLYSEALFFTGEYLKAREFLASLFNHPEQNEELWNVYLSHNKRLYKARAWEESHELALTLQNTKLGKLPEKFTFLANIAQENAFQLAFEAEKVSPQNLPLLRKWYEVAFNLPSADMAVKIKAWHNYLLSFSAGEAELFEAKLKTFVKAWHPVPATFTNLDLHFNIFAKAFKVFDEAKLPYKKASYLHLASLYTDNSQLRESLLWDALVLHASYHQWKLFEKRLHDLENLKALLLSDIKYQVALARFQFLKGDLEKSWELSAAIIAKDPEQGPVWTNITDLFTEGELREEIGNFLLTHEKKYRDIIWIRPLWARLKEKEYLAQADISGLTLDRTPAQIKSDDSEVIKAFKERLSRISSAYQLMQAKKEKLKKTIVQWIPATGAYAVCSSPRITEEATVALSKLKQDPIKSEQWPQFVTRLDEKIAELKTLAENEIKSCEKVKDELLFIGDFSPAKSPLPLESHDDEDKVIELENTTTNNKDRFILSLISGARAQAETYAASEKDPGLQIYFYTLLRLASHDVWNAYILLENLQKKKGWENHALYLKSLIAEKNGRKVLAQKWDVENQLVLTDLEEKLFSGN